MMGEWPSPETLRVGGSQIQEKGENEMVKLYGYAEEGVQGYRTKDGRDWFDTTANGVEFDGQTCWNCGCSIEKDQRVWVLPSFWMYPDRYF